MSARQSHPPVATSAIIPRATYRLQLHREFGFGAAIELLPYLDDLGVSHVYCSPIMRAAAGSLHGYDVVDHGEISPELGGREQFERLCRAAKSRGMGVVIDLVPNHMAVQGVDNPWWNDVLEHGQAALHAHYFDIDWRRTDLGLQGKVLLPILGTSYGSALEQGAFELALSTNESLPLAIAYYEHRLPIDPRTWPQIFQPTAGLAVAQATRERFDALSRAASSMSDRDPGADASERAASAVSLKASLLAILRECDDAMPALQAHARWLKSAEGRESMHALLEAQAYRLASWRVGADDINYRRFFDVNSLAALRVEEEDVFEATHAVALSLTSSGLVDGVRIDHPDGLRDPKTYFERLQRGHAQRVGLATDVDPVRSRPLYVVAEKIAAAHENVPTEWALHGTTGYRFANVVLGLYVDHRQGDRFERIWKDAAAVTDSYEVMAWNARSSAAIGTLASELAILAGMLGEVTASDRHWRDHGRRTLRRAIAEVAAAMPVYRTYVVDKPSAQDILFIDWAVSGARGRSEIADLSVFDMLRSCLRLELPAQASESARQTAQRFVWRFQQFCAPVAAKGIEDSAFYQYHRLVSLNDVGSDPATFGVTVKGFHGASADRAINWRHTMLATSTHDNKRSEDVRNRISVLSESPALWRLALRRWRRMTRSLRREVDGGAAPSARDEILLYQTLLGSFPSVAMDDEALSAYRERIVAYMIKAVRESKLVTNWVRHDTAYEEALEGFVRTLLARVDKNPAIEDLRKLADDLSWFGGMNSVSMTAIKFASPGVPDVYQGNEIIDLSLVDPDNRRPVDYALRIKWLGEMQQIWGSEAGRLETLRGWAQEPADGRLKMWTLWRLLTLRREVPDLFRFGSYLPLTLRGAAHNHAVAFARQWEGQTLIIVAPRLLRTLTKQTRRLEADAWGNTMLDLGRVLKGRTGPVDAIDLLSGTPLKLDSGGVAISDVLKFLPVAAIRVSKAGA